MGLIGKIERIKSYLHILKLKRINRVSDYIYEGTLLNSKVNIHCSPESKCHIKQIWAGAGEVDIGVYDSGELEIGKNVCLNSNIRILCRKKISIGEDTMIGHNVVIIDHDHHYMSNNWRNNYKSKEIIIGRNVWIGANVTILGGTTIGDNAVIGAGMVIKGNYESDTLYYCKQDVVSKTIVRS